MDPIHHPVSEGQPTDVSDNDAFDCHAAYISLVAEKQQWTRLKQVLNDALEEAEADVQAKTRLLANMSHEIRTPMTSILGYSELLLDNPLETNGEQPDREFSSEDYRKIIAEYRNTAREIQNNAQFLLAILNDILDFSKIEVGKMSIDQTEVSIRTFLFDIAAFHSIQAKAKNLNFTVKALTPLPEKIVTDPVRIKQILVNLIGNAIKFTAEGSINVSIEWWVKDQAEVPKEIFSRTGTANFSSEGSLLFSVHDTGIGIAAEDMPSLFEQFEQVKSPTKRQFGGTGLGLGIAKHLSQLLGGDLTVSSRLGEGSTFTVALPQTLPTEAIWVPVCEQFEWNNGPVKPVQETPTAGNEEIATTGKPLCGLRILLAEDGKDNQRLFAIILSKAGALVELADDGQIACQLAWDEQRKGTPFDIILMDMQMPVMDGYTATAELRNGGYAHPILALTAYAMAEEKQRCLAAGCNDYAAKPIFRDALIAAIVRNVQPQSVDYATFTKPGA